MTAYHAISSSFSCQQETPANESLSVKWRSKVFLIFYMDLVKYILQEQRNSLKGGKLQRGKEKENREVVWRFHREFYILKHSEKDLSPNFVSNMGTSIHMSMGVFNILNWEYKKNCIKPQVSSMWRRKGRKGERAKEWKRQREGKKGRKRVRKVRKKQRKNERTNVWEEREKKKGRVKEKERTNRS